MYVLLLNISTFSVWLPTLCVLFNYRQIKAMNAPFVYMILMMCIIDMTSNTLAEMGVYTIWLLLIYTVLEYGFMLWAQRTLMKKPMSTPALLSIVFVAAVVVIDCVFLCHLDNFNSLSRSTEAMLLIGHSLYALFYLQQTKEHIFLQRSPLFWLSFGSLFYMSGSLFVFIMEAQKYQFAGLGKEIWSIHSVFNVFFNLFLAKTALCLKRPSSSP